MKKNWYRFSYPHSCRCHEYHFTPEELDAFVKDYVERGIEFVCEERVVRYVEIRSYHKQGS